MGEKLITFFIPVMTFQQKNLERGHFDERNEKDTTQTTGKS